MTIAKRAFNNIFWLFVGEAISKGLIFLGTIYLARVLGKAGFGLFSLSLATGVYLWTVVEMGVVGYGIREIARNKNMAGELYNLLNSLRFILAIILFLIFSVAIYFIEMPIDKKFILIAGSFYIVAQSLLSDWVLSGIEKMQYLALGNIVTALFFLSGIYIFAKDSTGTLNASIVYSASFLAGSLILMLILYIKFNMPFKFTISFAKWRMHVKESFYFAINAAFNNLSLFVPIFFMGIWNTAEELGIFSAPHRLTILVIRAGGLVVTALYPVLSSLHIKNTDDFKRTHAEFQKIIIWIAMPICIIATLLSKDIVTFIFGNPYAESAGIFSLLIWLSFLMITRYSFGAALSSANFHRFNMFATGAGAAAIALTSILLIPHYNGYGAAWALISGEIVTLILMSGLFMEKIGYSYFFKTHLSKIILASIIMGLVVKVLHSSVIVSVIAGTFIYGVLSLSLGIISKKNIRELYPRRTIDEK